MENNQEISFDIFLRNFKNNVSKIGLKNSIQKDYILKMDIEGSEWDFFANAESSDIEKFRQMILEIHWLDGLRANDERYNRMVSVLSKINATHNLVLIHGNNFSPLFNYGDLVIPDVIEVLYLRKDSYNFVDDDEEFFDHPEYLNAPCTSEIPEINYYL